MVASARLEEDPGSFNVAKIRLEELIRESLGGEPIFN
jgi:hypothetical protein